MAAKSLTPGENEADIGNVIDGLYDLRALAAGGVAMVDETPDENVHNIGRLLRKIHEMAGGFIAQLDGLDLLQERKGGAA